MGLTEALLAALAFLPPVAVLIIIATLPFVELRGAVPIGILVYHLDWGVVLLASILGNLLPIPAILWGAPPVEAWFRRFPRCDRFLGRLFERTRARHGPRMVRGGLVALIVFVAIPLPFTGAWTGALLVYLLDLPRTAALGAIAAGVTIAGVLMLALSLLLGGAFSLF